MGGVGGWQQGRTKKLGQKRREEGDDKNSRQWRHDSKYHEHDVVL